MIEANRLIELIKQNATIYYADKEVKFPIPIFLNEKNLVKKEESYGMDIISTEDLYETEKQAEWALKYQRIPRMEYLDLPMWEEFVQLKHFAFIAKNAVRCKLVIFNNSKEEYIVVKTSLHCYFKEPLTEENYEKACDLCVKLFKGESDGI